MSLPLPPSIADCHHWLLTVATILHWLLPPSAPICRHPSQSTIASHHYLPLFTVTGGYRPWLSTAISSITASCHCLLSFIAAFHHYPLLPTPTHHCHRLLSSATICCHHRLPLSIITTCHFPSSLPAIIHHRLPPSVTAGRHRLSLSAATVHYIVFLMTLAQRKMYREELYIF